MLRIHQSFTLASDAADADFRCRWLRRLLCQQISLSHCFSDKSSTFLLGDEEFATSGHGSWMFKGFHAQIKGGSVFEAGLPHLGRYPPIGKSRVID